MSSPVPAFVSPPVSEMTPVNEVDVSLPPVVNVAVPSVIGAATCTVTLTDDRTVTASFGRNAGTFRLTVEANIANTGSGTVISGQQEISCTITQQTSGTCSADFPRGTQVTLTPLAGAQSSFGGWGGACSGFQGCTVTLNEDLTVSARFFRAIGIRLPGGTPTAPPAPQKSPVTTRTPRPPAR